MNFLKRLFSVPEREPLEKPSPPLTKIPAEGWFRIKVPSEMLTAVDPSLGGVLRVRLHDGIPVFIEPISTIDLLSEQDLSYTPQALARRRLVEI